MKLVKLVLKETVEKGYLCPKCHSPMSSGINIPGTNDEWLKMPHCTNCNFRVSDADHPFLECIPAEYRATVSKIGVYVGENEFQGKKLCSLRIAPYGTLPKSGPGNYWVGFLPVTRVKRKKFESDGQHNLRCHQMVRKVLGVLIGVEIKDEDKYLPMELLENVPGFYRFREDEV